MVWIPENCQQNSGSEAEADVIFCAQQCSLSPSFDLDSALSGKTEHSISSTAVVLPVSEYPESFIHPSPVNCIMNTFEYNANENENMQTSTQYTVDNLICIDNESWNMENRGVPVLDNATNINNVTDNGTELSLYEVKKDITSRKPRTRKDSTDSYDSSSSGEIFHHNYADTVSSVESMSFLLKASASDSDSESTMLPPQPIQDSYCNQVYMSCSSSEMLNESDDEILKNEVSSVTEALIEGPIEEWTSTYDKGDNSHFKEEDAFIPHPLVPIQEHEVITFNMEEVQPTEYIQITNNIISVDESFLFLSNTSLWDLESGKGGNRAVTMQNLHERSSFMDLTEGSKIGKACQKALLYLKDDINVGSLASLNKITSKQIEEDPVQTLSLISGSKGIDVVKSNKHMKNLLALSFCLTFLYIAIGSVRNLQSSINHEGGIGVLSMAFNSIGYTMGSLVSASIVLNFQPRKCIIINLIPNLLYVASNIYPTFWLMITISFIQGVSMAIIWNAISTYVTFLSRGKTQKTGELTDQVSSRYFGILCLMYQSHLIIGNLIASLVLMPGSGGGSSNQTALSSNIINTTGFHSSNLTIQYLPVSTQVAGESHLAAKVDGTISNSSTSTSHLNLCGANFCHHLDVGGSGFTVPNETKYLLFGIYIGCIIISLLIAVFLMEPLNPRLFTSSVKPLQKLKTQLSSLVHFLLNVKFLLLLPLLMYSVIQFGFVTAEFTKAFVTCSLGIHMVGYTMICFGVCGSISSYVGGLLTKFTGRIPLFVIAGSINLGLLIFMQQWQPTPDSLMPFFIIMGLWGVSDGIWMGQVSSLMGIIFPEKYEEAYAGLRMAHGIGPAIAFGYSSSICMEMKIYITVTLCAVSLVLYLLMEGLLRRKERNTVIKFKQTSV